MICYRRLLQCNQHPFSKHWSLLLNCPNDHIVVARSANTIPKFRMYGWFFNYARCTHCAEEVNPTNHHMIDACIHRYPYRVILCTIHVPSQGIYRDVHRNLTSIFTLDFYTKGWKRRKKKSPLQIKVRKVMIVAVCNPHRTHCKQLWLNWWHCVDEWGVYFSLSWPQVHCHLFIFWCIRVAVVNSSYPNMAISLKHTGYTHLSHDCFFTGVVLALLFSVASDITAIARESRHMEGSEQPTRPTTCLFCAHLLSTKCYSSWLHNHNV